VRLAQQRGSICVGDCGGNRFQTLLTCGLEGRNELLQSIIVQRQRSQGGGMLWVEDGLQRLEHRHSGGRA
jgi:hypothetical protein